METGLAKPNKTLILCSVFIAGTGTILAGYGTYLLIASFILICLLFLFLFKKLISSGFAILIAAIFIFSVIYSNFRTPTPDKLYALAPANLNLRGLVVSEPKDNLKAKTKFYFKVNQLKNKGNWIHVKSKTIVYIYDKQRKFENIKIGDIIELYGSVNQPFTATNPGEFDYGKYLNSKGVFTMTYVRHDKYEIIGNSGVSIWFFLDKLTQIRSRIMEVHRKYLASPKIELLAGMVFGNHAIPTPKFIQDNFRKSGLLHLLAASGLNVGIIFGIWFFLATRFGISFKPKIITGMVLVGVYSLLTGLPPSITRAMLMMEFVLLGKLLDRRADSSVLLVIVSVLMLLFNPLMISNVGFQLSVVVTLGLLMFVPLLVRKAKPVPKYLSGAFLVPFVAQVFVEPILAFHFNTFAIYSIPTNILVIPFVGVISFSGFLGSIFALIPFIGEKVCFIADKIAEPFISLLLFITGYVSKLPGAIHYLPKPSPVEILVFYLFLFSLFVCIKKDFSYKKLNITALTLFFVFIVLTFKGNFDFNKNLKFVFFDVGEGDSILIKTPEKKYILVDTGPSGKYSPAKMAIVPYLRDKGITGLDAIVMTHPDRDHTGGTTDILRNMDVKEVFYNGVKRKSKNFLSIQKYISQNNVREEILKDGDKINFDDSLKIQVIRSPNTNLENDNEDSLVLYIVYKDFSALLMADCEAESLKKLEKQVKAPVNLLKVGHHGSRKSINADFMKYLHPQIAVISVGKRGYHLKHPNPKVIRLLNEFKSKILRTDKDFAIQIITDGNKINYETYAKQKR